MSKKRPEGVVYSTNPDFQYDYGTADDEPQTLPPDKQRLRLRLEKHHRGGKEVSIVGGFVGSEADLLDLAKRLKNKCGVGGSAKEGEIVIQGNQLDKLRALLLAEGYGVK